jgi:hypothetical protein
LCRKTFKNKENNQKTNILYQFIKHQSYDSTKSDEKNAKPESNSDANDTQPEAQSDASDMKPAVKKRKARLLKAARRKFHPKTQHWKNIPQ